VPRLSKTINRPNDDNLSKNRAFGGSSQIKSTCEIAPGVKTMSNSPSPTTWYAIFTSPLCANRVVGTTITRL
jgi:hypothetical protein